MELINTGWHLLLIVDTEIRVNDYITDKYNVWQWKDDSSLLGMRKVIAYYPLKEESKEYDNLILLPPPLSHDYMLKADEWLKSKDLLKSSQAPGLLIGFTEGYKAASKLYTSNDLQTAFSLGRTYEASNHEGIGQLEVEEYIQMLSHSDKLPKEFIPEIEQECSCACHQPGVMMMHMMPCCYPGSLVIRYINGKRELVGKYKY